jgi:5'-3' exonuclease
MILLDFSNIIVSSIMVASRVPDEERFSEDFIRHLVLNSIRSYRKKYHEKYGEVVICTDYLSSWRKDAFLYYKAHRKILREKQQKEGGMDWKALFEIIAKIIEELEDYFPYKVVQIPHAEGDDVIAVLAKHLKEPCLIVSSDKDFNQLYKYKTVRQFSPMKHQMLKGIDPVRYLKEHIIRGDKGDGIPNILSADDTIVEGTRQKSISKKKVANWLVQDPENFKDDMKHGWSRNQELIDFEFIPPSIAQEILIQYNEKKEYQQGQLMNYFIKNRLKYLMENMGDFTK